MDGVHDLGGMHGFGPVEVEPDEPVFHRTWEGRTFGLVAVTIGLLGGNTPRFRHAIERMDPAHYLSSSYYEHWMTALATLLVESGYVTHHELEERGENFPLSRPVAVGPDGLGRDAAPAQRSHEAGDAAASSTARRAPARPTARRKAARPAAADQAAASNAVADPTPNFEVGDAVRVRDVQFAGHARCPRYLRGREGNVARVDPAAAVPELEAHRGERVLEPHYCVRFAAAELWGETAEQAAPVYVDLCERYIERVQERA